MTEDLSHSELIIEVKRLQSELDSLQAQCKKKNLRIKKLDLHSKQTPLALIDWDLDFKVLFWNKSAEKMFGYTSDETIGKYVWELILPATLKDLLITKWEQLKAQKKGAVNSNINITKKGKEIYCDWYNTPLIDENGDLISVTSIAVDVTKQINTDQELIESRERFKSLSNANFEGIFILEKSICIEANEAGCNLFGYTYEEIIGLNALAVIADEYKQTVLKNIISGYQEPYEVIGLRKDGSKFHAEIQGKDYDLNGKIVRVTALRNIDKRKRAESELRASETKFRSIFEHSGDGILIGNLQGIIVDVNDSFCTISGYTKDEIINRSIK